MDREAAHCSTTLKSCPVYIGEIDSPDYDVLAVRRERPVILVQCFHRAFEEGWIEPLMDGLSDNRDGDFHSAIIM